MKNEKMFPVNHEPVVAKIQATTDLGTSVYYEVVYCVDTTWKSYEKSETFSNGEQVLDWMYCDNIFRTPIA